MVNFVLLCWIEFFPKINKHNLDKVMVFLQNIAQYKKAEKFICNKSLHKDAIMLQYFTKHWFIRVIK